MVLQAATAVLVVVAILVGIQDPHISLGQPRPLANDLPHCAGLRRSHRCLVAVGFLCAGATLRTTMHTKMLAFLGSFVVLTVKFLLYKKWQRKYGPLCTPFARSSDRRRPLSSSRF